MNEHDNATFHLAPAPSTALFLSIGIGVGAVLDANFLFLVVIGLAGMSREIADKLDHSGTFSGVAITDPNTTLKGCNMNRQTMTVDIHSNPLHNQLLAALPQDAWERLRPALEHVHLERRQPLSAARQPMTHAYFPTSAVVSLMHFTESGSSAESAVVGNDGMVGVSLVMGGVSSSSSAVVQAAGEAYRLPGTKLQSEFARSADMMRLLLRYSQALLTQSSQRALCNRHHSLPQQLARVLLLQLDLVDGCEIVMTHEMIAEQLGVRREGVTEGAGALQRLEIIRCGRGRITILDRAALERAACECYADVRLECQRLLQEQLAA